MFRLGAVLGAAILAVVLTSLAWILLGWLTGPKVRKDLPLYKKSDLPGVQYEHIPGSTGAVAGIPVRINSLGFRGPEIAPEKPAGVTRIAVLGDSFIFGQGVNGDETLPAVLENLLNRGGKHKYQVINAGVRGYGSYEESVYLRARVMPLKPDGVILAITEADDLVIEPFRFQPAWLQPAQKSFWWKLAPARAYLALRAQQEYIKAGREFIAGLYDPRGEAWKRFVSSLTDIQRQCRDQGVWLLVITFPLLENGNTFAKERKQLHRELSELGIAYIDPKPELDAYPWQKLAVSKRDPHPNPQAQRIFARLLDQKLRQLGYE